MASPQAKLSETRLGSDPFANLGFPAAKKLKLVVKNQPSKMPSAAKKLPVKGKAKAKPKSQNRAKNTPQAAPKTSIQGPQWDFEALERRLDEAMQHLQALPLPDGPPPRTTVDELFDFIRNTLSIFSPLYYYRQMRQILYAERSLIVDPFGLDPVFEERAERLADFFYRYWWRVNAYGVENIPAGGRTLLVSNHSGMLPYDGAMIKHAVRTLHPARRTVRFLVENFAFYFPILGTLIYRYGGVRASMDNAMRLLNDDQLTCVFPEGVKGLGKHYRHRYQLQRFGRGGFIKLALNTRSPIVPVGVIGAEEIHPIIGNADFLKKPLRLPYVPLTPTFPWFGPLGLIPLPSKWTIVFGEPLTFPLEYGPEEADNELLINELTLKVRRLIHEMIYDQLATRQSVFFG